jgi:hypothetical protein
MDNQHAGAFRGSNRGASFGSADADIGIVARCSGEFVFFFRLTEGFSQPPFADEAAATFCCDPPLCIASYRRRTIVVDAYDEGDSDPSIW